MPRLRNRLAVFALLFACIPAQLAAQALPGISSLRVAYNTRKAMANPQGDLKVKLGAEVTYIEVPGGNHVDVVVPNLPKVFEFLAAHKKATAPTPR